MLRKAEMVGKRFGRLTVIAPAPPRGDRPYYRCLCECGNESEVFHYHLRSGHTQSCGCLYAWRKINEEDIAPVGIPVRVFFIKTPRPDERTNSSWRHMIARCHNPKDDKFKWYGARGITVCDRWRKSFASFRADMGNRPEGKTIHRIDNDGNYEPGNCEWATPAVQACHRQRNVMLTIDGVTACAAIHAAKAGLPSTIIYPRIRNGWEEKDLFRQPARKYRIFTINGITGCMLKVAKHFGIEVRTVRSRIDHYGWDPVRAFTTPAGKYIWKNKPGRPVKESPEPDENPID